MPNLLILSCRVVVVSSYNTVMDKWTCSFAAINGEMTTFLNDVKLNPWREEYTDDKAN